jgi:acyl-CoA thioester hydrolase
MRAAGKFVWPARVRFVDTDASGRIHFSALFRIFEVAEEEFFRARGGDTMILEGQGLSLPRVHVEADYKRWLAFGDEVDVEVGVERIGNSSYTLAFTVRKKGEEAVAASGKIVAAVYSTAAGRAVPMPAEILRVLEA